MNENVTARHEHFDQIANKEEEKKTFFSGTKEMNKFVMQMREFEFTFSFLRFISCFCFAFLHDYE